MPLRLIIPFGIIYVNWKCGDWIYEQLRLKWYGYHRSMNNISSIWFGYDDTDIPAPRKFDMKEKWTSYANYLLYEQYLNLRHKEDVTRLTNEDPEYAQIPKIITNNDITLKESLITGNRERERYNFDKITRLPIYYRRWRDRSKPELDQVAKDIAAKKKKK
eukprot:796105_1